MRSSATALGNAPAPLAQRWRRAALWTTFGLIAAFGLIGLAHTPVGRPLMALLQATAGCPVPGDIDPARSERARLSGVANLRGTEPSRSHRVVGLDLALGQTRKVAALAVMAQRGAACREARQASVLKCAMPASGAGDGTPNISDAHLQFDTAGRLSAVDLFRVEASAEDAVAWLDRLDHRLARQVAGPTSGGAGPVRASYLNRPGLRRVERTYAASDLVVILSATRFGKRGVRVREVYHFLPRLAGVHGNAHRG